MTNFPLYSQKNSCRMKIRSKKFILIEVSEPYDDNQSSDKPDLCTASSPGIHGDVDYQKQTCTGGEHT